MTGYFILQARTWSTGTSPSNPSYHLVTASKGEYFLGTTGTCRTLCILLSISFRRSSCTRCNSSPSALATGSLEITLHGEIVLPLSKTFSPVDPKLPVRSMPCHPPPHSGIQKTEYGIRNPAPGIRSRPHAKRQRLPSHSPNHLSLLRWSTSTTASHNIDFVLPPEQLHSRRCHHGVSLSMGSDGRRALGAVHLDLGRCDGWL